MDQRGSSDALFAPIAMGNALDRFAAIPTIADAVAPVALHPYTKIFVMPDKALYQ